MPNRKRRPAAGLSAPTAYRNALKLWQIALAAPQVIGHRTGRMAVAGPLPDARDRAEFTLMGQEKAEAFQESLAAMAAQIYQSNGDLANYASRQWWNAWTALASGLAGQSPAQVAKVQQAYLRAIDAAATGKRLTSAVARVVDKGLRPVHRRVTANARRLRGVKV